MYQSSVSAHLRAIYLFCLFGAEETHMLGTKDLGVGVNLGDRRRTPPAGIRPPRQPTLKNLMAHMAPIYTIFEGEQARKKLSLLVKFTKKKSESTIFDMFLEIFLRCRKFSQNWVDLKKSRQKLENFSRK